MKRLAKFGCAALLLSGLLQAQLSVPKLGTLRLSDGSTHSVDGLTANIIVDPRPLSAADSASFSNSGGLTSSKGLIRLMSAGGVILGEYQSVEPRPILNIDSSLLSAVVWLPSEHMLLGWDGKAFTTKAVDDSAFGGAVTFVRKSSSKAVELFVERADDSVAKLTVSLTEGRLLNAEAQPEAHGAVFVQQGWMLWQNGRGLTAEGSNGKRQAIELSKGPLPPDDLRIERMSNDWLHVLSQSTGANWAVYLNAAKLSVSLLPPPVREATK
jgi:hypothetical protein